MPEEFLKEIENPANPANSYFLNPKIRLKAALEILEKFTRSRSQYFFPSFPPGFETETGLSKMIDLTKDFLSFAFFQKIREKTANEREKIESTLLKALDDVKRFHPIVSQKQSDDAKHLATRALATISTYNKAFTQEAPAHFCWHKRLWRFLTKKGLPSISKTHSVKLPPFLKEETFSQTAHTHRSETIRTLLFSKKTTVNLSEREADAFRMKAISLIKNQPILFPSIRDSLKAVKETPIYSVAISQDTKENSKETSIITLEQTLRPFPGEVVILRGSFKRDPTSPTPSMPISDSFQMTTESVQTGFPYPLQHTGWALSDALIPTLPLRPHACKPLFELIEQKKQITLAFINKAPLLENSWKLYRHRNEIAQKNKREFLFLHQNLAKAITLAAPHRPSKLKTNQIIEEFFLRLEQQDDAIGTLANLYYQLAVQFFEEPLNRLKQCWLEESNKDLYARDAKKRYKTAQAIIEENLKNAEAKLLSAENWNTEFLSLLGKIMGKAGAPIYLQSFSESLECAPPQLSKFERALQSAALIQQEEFIQEIKSDNFYIKSFIDLKDSLTREIELFQTGNSPHRLCSLIEKYYISRFVNP